MLLSIHSVVTLLKFKTWNKSKFIKFHSVKSQVYVLFVSCTKFEEEAEMPLRTVLAEVTPSNVDGRGNYSDYFIRYLTRKSLDPEANRSVCRIFVVFRSRKLKKKCDWCARYEPAIDVDTVSLSLDFFAIRHCNELRRGKSFEIGKPFEALSFSLFGEQHARANLAGKSRRYNSMFCLIYRSFKSKHIKRGLFKLTFYTVFTLPNCVLESWGIFARDAFRTGRWKF